MIVHCARRYNTEESIRGFAKSCFEYALGKGWCARSLVQLCNPAATDVLSLHIHVCARNYHVAKPDLVYRFYAMH